ncbi:MAG: DinB family protein [Candidatus Thorarchaeota archaeon]|nr:DinB family protein [Candidatus Thorarchaeota archaeon]
MVPSWFREMVIQAHENQRTHLHYVLKGLTNDELIKTVTSEEYSRSIAGIVMHIGTAETYWFHKAGNSIGPPVIADTFEEVISRIHENTEKITMILKECPEEQLRIIPPKDGGPSIAWAVLRTSQHGIYHTGQIAKIRRMIGASELPPDPDNLWGKAVDSTLGIIRALIDES